MVAKRRILGLDISTIRYRECLDLIIELSRSRKSSYVCVANVHMCMEAYNKKDFQDCVNAAEFVVADGVPIAKAINLLYGIRQERIAGMDLLPDLIEGSESEGLSVFFYGSTDSVLFKTQEYCEANYPQLAVAGCISPPFRELSKEEEEEITSRINTSGCNIVFVALGCPKQEYWMANMKGKINALMIGIGGALPVLTGEQKRAPIWMQKLALEWFYRFLQEPRRLFKRYLITNSKFIWLLGYQLIREKLIKIN